jgi:hypothetical protein
MHKGLTTKELNILQDNRILSNIKNIIDKVNSLTQIKTGIKISNYILPYTVESKLFYKYGEKGYEVLALLKKYLNSLHFVDIFFLLVGTDPETFINKLDIYRQKIDNKAFISHNFRYKDLEFKLKIKNVTPTNKMSLSDKEQIIIQHHIEFNIFKVNLPPYHKPNDMEIVEKVLKHTTKTKFVIERVYPDENLDYKPMCPSGFYTCVKPKAKIEDYIKDPFMWNYILAMSNEKRLKKLLENY